MYVKILHLLFSISIIRNFIRCIYLWIPLKEPLAAVCLYEILIPIVYTLSSTFTNFLLSYCIDMHFRTRYFHIDSYVYSISYRRLIRGKKKFLILDTDLLHIHKSIVKYELNFFIDNMYVCKLYIHTYKYMLITVTC